MSIPTSTVVKMHGGIYLLVHEGQIGRVFVQSNDRLNWQQIVHFNATSLQATESIARLTHPSAPPIVKHSAPRLVA